MKNLITYLKTLWSWVADSQSTDVSLDCRLTVGSPSFHRRSTMLKLVSVLALIFTLGVGNAWGALSSPYECTFTSGMSMSGSNCTTGDVTWTVSTTTGKGSPTITFGNQNGQSCIKFGSGKSNYYSSMTLTTSAFSSCNVSSVVIYLSSNNGGSKTVTVSQGATTIGTGSQSFSSTTWVTNCTRNTTAGSGGNLSIEISSDATATFVHSITVTYTANCSGTKLGTPVVTASPSSNRIDLSWPAVANASSYQLKWNGGDWAAATSPVSKTGLTNGTSYTYQVRAIGNGSTYCDGDPSAEASAIPGTYYTVTFMCNGSTYATKSIRSGQHLELPDNPSPCMVGKEFVGWATAAINGSTNTKPTFASTFTTITSNKTYYAVFATKTANSYKQGTANDLIEGQKVLIVNTNSSKAMANTTDSDGKLTAKSVTISSSTISSSDASLVWTVELDGTKYKFKNTYYVYISSAARNKLWCDDEDYLYPDSWTISDAGSSYYYLTSDRSTSSYKLEYYSNYFTSYDANTTNPYKMQFFVPTYTGYVTSCCTPLGTINGSVSWSNAATAVVSWDDLAHVSSWTVKYKTHAAVDWSTAGASSASAGTRSVTIISLTPCTNYDFKIIATPDDGYCDKDQTIEDSQTHNWTVTSTITNGTKTSVPTTACGDYTATFAATSGYHFPAKANVSVTGASDFSWNSSTGVLSIDGEDITGNISISITCPPDACSDWGFYYGTDKVADWAYECFTKVKPADATDHEWQTDEIALPNKPNWYIDNATEDDGKKKVATWDELYFAMSQGDGARPMVGTATGATGKVRIYDNWDWNNRAAGFLPTGYVMKFGSTEYPFTFVASNEYRTEIVDLNSTTYANVVSVGIEDGEGDYVSTGNTQEYRHVFFVPSAAWKTGSAKFCIHYWDGGSLNARSNYMSAVPGKSGWYEGWLPTAATGFQFERQNPAGDSPTEGNRWTAGADQTLQSNKNCYTMTASGGESDWDGTVTTSLYTSKGKFRMWDNSTSKNWYVTFYPHYVLHFDANSGTGAPADQSVALDASPCQLTVSSTAPTRSNYTFLGWNESSSATSPDGDWDGGDTHAMTGDVTLYAVWAANHTLTYNYNGGEGSSCVGGTKYTGESFTACSSAGDKEGHTFTGWLGSNSVSYTAGSSYSMPNSDLTLTAQWSPNHYDVTLNVNSGTINAGDIDEYTYGVGATLPTDVTRDGYRFDGWFDNVGLTGSKVTTISTTATGDKEYWAKWTAVYTVTWHVGNGTWSVGEHSVTVGNTQVASGEKIDAMPDAPADNTLSACASKFMGWSKKNYGSTSGKDGSDYNDLFTTVGGSPAISAATDFYAVFAEGTGAAVNTVMWSENWTGYADDAEPTGPNTGVGYGAVKYGSATISYSWVDGTTSSAGTSEVSTDNGGNLAGGSSPEAKIGKKGSGGSAVGGYLEISGIPNGGADSLTLTYKQNGQSLTVSISGSGYSMRNNNSDVTSFSHSAKGTYTHAIACGSDATFTLKFQAAGNNVRLDDIEVKVRTVSYANYRTQCDPNIVKVTYNANGGSTTCADGSHDKRNDYTVCSSAPTRDYYTFAGWLCSVDDEVYAASATIDDAVIDADFSLTAQWTPVNYSISYNLNGGTNAADPITAYTVETVSALPTPTKGHDRFDGWFTDNGVWSNQIASITAGMHGDLTLYAKWTSRNTIIFEVDGSPTTIYRANDENLEDAVAGQGSKPDEPDAPSACSSKVFVGWSESTIDDETDTRPGDLTNATGTVNSDKHYYAVWALQSGTPIAAVEDNSFTTSGIETYCGMTNGMKDVGDYILKNSIWTSSNMSDVQVKIKVYHLSNKIADVLRISLVNSSGVEVVGTDLSTTAFGTSSSSAAYSSYVTLTPTSAVTGYKVALKTKNSNGACVDKVTREVVATYTKYSTSCCSTKVTLSQNSPEHGTIAFGKAKVPTCGDKEVSLTITPAAGYQLHSYEVATGSGKVGTKSVSPAIALDNNSSAAQNITLTFADEANGAYDVTASFTKMAPTAWEWTYKSAAIPNPINLYVGQTATLNATYTPSGLLNSEQDYNVTKSANLTQTSKTYATPDIHYTFRADAAMDDGTVTITNKVNALLETTVHVHVDPLPRVHFVDKIHGESFDDVVATLTDNELTDDGVGQTPTYSDVSDPGSSYNTCERQHLHLVGWILSTWADAHPGALPSEIVAAGATNYYAAGADINLEDQNNKTFYAVWSKVE